MSSSDVSIEQDEPDVSLENSPSLSLSSDNSSHHSSDRIAEMNDIEATPLAATPPSNIQANSNIESLPLDFEVTPSMTFETTPSINFTATPSLDLGATPSLDLGATPSLDLGATPSLDLGATPSLDLGATPSLDLGATPSLDLGATPSLDLGATPSLDLGATPSLDLGATPSLDLGATPSLNLSASPSLSLDTTPNNIATDIISIEGEHGPIEQSEYDTEPQADLLEILSEVVTKAGEQAEVANKTSVPFPLTRVKTIMKTDPDTSLIQADAVVLVGEAAKLFLKRFCRDSQKVTAGSKRKIVNRADVDTCINRYDEYSFLEEQLDW